MAPERLGPPSFAVALNSPGSIGAYLLFRTAAFFLLAAILYAAAEAPDLMALMTRVAIGEPRPVQASSPGPL